MKRVLLTGMSGTGKSIVIQALSARGFKAVDTDDGWCEPLPGGRQRWREEAIGQLLDTEDAAVLFVAGCEENQVRFHPRFDLIILLSAPAEVLAGRLASRTTNSFGRPVLIGYWKGDDEPPAGAHPSRMSGQPPCVGQRVAQQELDLGIRAAQLVGPSGQGRHERRIQLSLSVPGRTVGM